MSHRFALTIPYRAESEYGGLNYRPGDLKLHRSRQDGSLLLPVTGPALRAGGWGRVKHPKVYGKAFRAVDGTDGLWLLLHLDSPDAVRMMPEWLRRPHSYYGKPVVGSDGYLDAIEIQGISTFAASRLMPYSPGVDLAPFDEASALLAQLRGPAGALQRPSV